MRSSRKVVLSVCVCVGILSPRQCLETFLALRMEGHSAPGI